jgi:hypothetical protein
MAKKTTSIYRVVSFSTLFFVLIPLLGRADETVFGGQGCSVFPVGETKIRMVSQKVKLVKTGTEVVVQCEYVFANPGKKTEVTMAFPVEMNAAAYQAQKRTGSPHPLVRDFKILVNNKPVGHLLKSIADKPNIRGLYFDYAFFWKVKFPKYKWVRVKNTYRFDKSGDSKGNWYIPYLLRTGAIWPGKIDTLDITIDLGAIKNTEYLEIKPKGYTYQKGLVHWRFKNIDPEWDVEVRMPVDKEPAGGICNLTHGFLYNHLGLEKLYNSGDPSSFNQVEAFRKLDALEQDVKTNRLKYPAKCRKSSLALLESYRARINQDLEDLKAFKKGNR